MDSIKYRLSGAGSKRRHRGWGAPVRRLEEGCSLGGCGHCERVYPRTYWGAEPERYSSLKRQQCM
eukprot:2251275-Pleurochrysis_carterae.AAC.1